MGTVLQPYGGITGILLLLVLILMVAVVAHGFWPRGRSKSGKSAGGQRLAAGRRALSPSLFAQQEYQALVLKTDESGYDGQEVASLVAKLNVDMKLLKRGVYAASQHGKLLFYIASGYGEGRLDQLVAHTTRRLVFITPLGWVEKPTEDVEFMLRAAVTFGKMLGGVLTNEQGQKLTYQGITQLRDRVRDWELREQSQVAAW